MKAYKCDRCGEYFTKKPMEKFYITDSPNSINHMFPILDLCPDCNDALVKFMGVKKQEKSEVEE